MNEKQDVTVRKQNCAAVVDAVENLSGELRAYALARCEEMLADGWKFGGVETRQAGKGKARHVVAVRTHWWRASAANGRISTTSIEDEQES